MEFDPSRCALVACDVFMEELAALDPHKGSWHSTSYLEMGLHDQPDILRVEVQNKINQLEEDTTVDTILLLYGVCGNGLIGVKSEFNVALPTIGDRPRPGL